MLEINVFLTLLCLWLFVFLNNKFLKVAKINKIRYQVFALRDELALLAMRGEVDPAGKEYKTLRYMMNGSIKALGTFSLVSFVRFSISLFRDKELQKRLDRISSKLTGHGNTKFRDIVLRYFKIMHSTFDKNTWLLMRFILPLFILLMLPFVETRRIFKQKAETLELTDKNFESRINQLTPAECGQLA